MSDDNKPSDDRLGLNAPISRRDFLDGTLIGGAGLFLGGLRLPRLGDDAALARIAERYGDDPWTGYSGVGDYRYSNGNTLDVMSMGHTIRDGTLEQRIAAATDTDETYDMVSVGGGISGLAAA